MPVPQTLHSALDGVLSSAPTYRQLVEVIDFCHKSAMAYLKAKASRGRFDVSRFGVRLEDFAMDSIADLFRRNTAGDFEALQRYCDAIAPRDAMTAEVLEGSIRRLVFSAVNQHIFRSMRDFDSGLAKIIRNLKLSLKDHPAASLGEVHGMHVIFSSGKGNLHAPMMSPEFLEAAIRTELRYDASLKKILSAINVVLDNQSEYAQMVPLIQVAVMIRAMFGDDVNPVSVIPDHGITKEEVTSMIDHVMKQMGKHGETYIKRGRLTEVEVRCYLESLRRLLFDACCDGKPEQSYFDVLRSVLPQLTRNQYQHKHRAIFEYMAKLAKAELKSAALKEL